MFALPITVDEYFAHYKGHKAITPQYLLNATVLLARVNEVRRLAAADGVELLTNPITGCGISGEGNGGWRPPECTVGAIHSTHKLAHGIDNYDPKTTLARWAYSHRDVMKQQGLTMEDHRYTPHWAHMQDALPAGFGGVWRIDYVPTPTTPLILPLPEQRLK